MAVTCPQGSEIKWVVFWRESGGGEYEEVRQVHGPFDTEDEAFDWMRRTPPSAYADFFEVNQMHVIDPDRAPEHCPHPQCWGCGYRND